MKQITQFEFFAQTKVFHCIFLKKYHGPWMLCDISSHIGNRNIQININFKQYLNEIHPIYRFIQCRLESFSV